MENKSDLQEFSMHLSRREMRAYLSDKLTSQDNHRIDKHLKFCEQCSIAMTGIVEDDHSNYKQNLAKVNDKLKVPIKKNIQWNSAKIKKGLLIAASVSMLSFTAYAFYSFVTKDATSSHFSSIIPVKPVKEEQPKELKDQNSSGKEKNVNENKAKEEIQDPSQQEIATNSKNEAKEVKQTPVKSAEPKPKEIKPETPVTASNSIENKTEKKSEEVSNSILVARRKESNTENTVSATAQPVEEETADTGVKVVDANPTGGYGAFNQYLAGNLQYPENAIDSKIEGQVPVEFLVEKDGSLSNFTVKKPLGYGCDKEAIRLIKAGPKWNPATEDGKTVDKTVTVTIHFKLEE